MTRRLSPVTVATGAAVVAALMGYAATAVFGPVHVGRMLPWVLGRGLGIGAYLGLTALTAAGLWLRHPWRLRVGGLHPEALLRVHAALGALTLLLVSGHVVALVLDTYAGVGVLGAVVPGQASYRPVAVALGTVSIYLGLLVGGSAALAGRLARRAWLPIHRVALAVFATGWLHGVLAGSATATLRWMYVATGLPVVLLAASRQAARRSAAHAAGNAA